MLAPSSFAGISLPHTWVRPVRPINQTQSQAQGAAQTPLQVVPVPNSDGRSMNGGAPSKMLPRGSLLDLSV
jgi:hypothetical protein